MKRTPVKRKRSGPARRGRVIDTKYYAWLGKQPGSICGGKTHSRHHVRFCGSPKDDRRALPMEYGYHQIQEGPHSIEALGKDKFEALHKINLEQKIAWYQAEYLRQHPGVDWSDYYLAGVPAGNRA